MSWERELKRLDDQLADGTIDRTEYRRLRDDLLAEVSSVPTMGRRVTMPIPEKPTEPEQEKKDEQPLRWAAANPGALPIAEPKPEPASAPVPVAEVPTPEGTTRLATGPAGALDGTAVFRDARPDRGRAGVIALVVVVVLVVIAGAGAIWLFGLRPGAQQQTEGRPVPVPKPAPVDTRTLNSIAAAVPALPGTEKPGTGIVSPSVGVQLGLYSQALADTMTSQGVHTVLLRFTTQSSTAGTAITIDNDSLLVVPAASASQAARNTTALADYERSVGWTPVPGGGLPAGVTTMNVTVSNQDVRTALFRSGDYTVWLAVGHAPASDQATLSADFQRIASSVVAAVKPG